MNTIRVAVFTGKMSKSRAAIESEAVSHGVNVEPRVTSQTTHLVVGERPGKTKMDAAKKWGVMIITESQYRAALANGSVPRATREQKSKEEEQPVKPKKKSNRRKNITAWLTPIKEAGRGIGF